MSAQSKRTSTRHRAKVARKIREHNRKLNKGGIMLAKGHGRNHTKSHKEPSLPTNMPNREAFISRMQMEQEKEHTRRQQILARNDLGALAAQAQADAEAKAASDANDNQDEFTSSSAAPALYDSSKRAFYREFQTVLDTADVILQVLDARDPMGSRVAAVEQAVLQSGGRKRLVLVLNKIDLVPRDVVTQWLQHLRKEFPTVAFKASTQKQRSGLGSISMHQLDEQATQQISECLGADTLIQLLKNYSRSLDLKMAIRVGVVGYPNVGKSSLINSLKRSKVCNVGSTPGVTTARQEINLDRNIRLLDCPGIVFSPITSGSQVQADLFLRNVLKIEQIEDPIAPVDLIIQRTQVEQMMALYALPRYESTVEFLSHLAHQQGKLKKGAIPNLEAAARSVLYDWNQGKIPFYTLPPNNSSSSNTGASTVVASQVVQDWAPAFDLESVQQLEVDRVLSALSDHAADSSIVFSFNTAGSMHDDSVMMAVDQDAVNQPRMVVDLQARLARHGGASTSKSAHSNDGDDGYDVQMTAAEMELNPQTNKMRARQIKKAKKAAMRAASLEAMQLE